MKNAIITGASRGIGRAAAKTLARAGYNLGLCCSKTQPELDELIFELKKEYPLQKFEGFLCDVSDYDQVKSMIDDIERLHGETDVLVNNAGIAYAGLLTDMGVDDWNRVIGVNLNSVFFTCKCVIPGMVRRKEGRIINISSMWGNVGASCEVAYSASKGGINSFTRALGKELAPSNISVNAIACGCIDTSMNDCYSPEEKEELADQIPIGRFANPEEIASVILQLIESTPYITGQVITVDGGML